MSSWCQWRCILRLNNGKAVEDDKGSKQCRAMMLVVVGHRPGAALLQWANR